MAAAGISIATLLRMSGAGAADDDFSLELYGRYAARLFRYCRRLTPDADAAEDAVQATVLDAARLLGAGFRPEFEAAWLFELAQRHAAEGASRPRRRAVAALPDELRKPLELRLEGRPYSEIAEALGVARGTIELRVLRARSAAQPRRASRLGDLASLGGALKALLAGGAAVPATVAAVGAVAVLPRVVRHDSPPARPTPAVVAPKVEPAAPTAAAVVRSPRRSVAAHPGRTAPLARRQAPERARPAAATPIAATAPSAPVAAAPSASAPPASPSPSAPSSSAPSPEAVPRPAPAPTSASAPVPAAASTPVPAPSPQPVAPATSTPALEPVAVPPVASDPVAATTAVVDQVAGTVPALPAVPPVPAPAPVPTLP